MYCSVYSVCILIYSLIKNIGIIFYYYRFSVLKNLFWLIVLDYRNFTVKTKLLQIKDFEEFLTY